MRGKLSCLVHLLLQARREKIRRMRSVGSHFILDLANELSQNCSNKLSVIVTVKDEEYNPKTFQPVQSSGNTTKYKLCKFHAHVFVYIHRLSHTFYNAYRNFEYWVSCLKKEEWEETNLLFSD